MLFSPNELLRNLLNEVQVALFDPNISYSVISDLYQRFCNFFHGCKKLESKHIQLLAQCCMQYINCIQTHIDSTPICENEYIEALKQYIGVVEEISQLDDVRDSYLEYITVPIFEKVTEPDLKPWFAKELLKNFNLAVRGTRRHVLYTIVEKHPLYLCKLADLICTCGDYDYQEQLLETIFNMCTERQINHYANQMFPTLPEFKIGLCSISKDNFDIDRRTFLNLVNSEIKNVISIKCNTAQLGNTYLGPPKVSEQDELPIWADFNLCTQTISLYCDKDSLRSCPPSENSVASDAFELIIVNFDDISSVFVSRLLDSTTVPVGNIIIFNMTSPCSFIFPTSLEVSKATQLKLCIYKCPTLNTLVETTLPYWFKNKIKHLDEKKGSERQQKNRRKRMDIANIGTERGEYKSLPIQKPLMGSKSTGALSNMSSTSDAESLKDRLAAHQAEDYRQSLKKRISKSPKFHNVEQLKEIAADPEYSLLAKKQEENRFLAKKANISKEPQSDDISSTSDHIIIQNENTEKRNINPKPVVHVARKKEIIKVKWAWPMKVSIGKCSENTQDHQKTIQKISFGQKEPAEAIEDISVKSLKGNEMANKKTSNLSKKLEVKNTEKGRDSKKTQAKKIPIKNSTETEAAVTTELSHSDNSSTLNILIGGNICGHTEPENVIKNIEDIISDTPDLIRNTDSTVYEATPDLEVNKSIVEKHQVGIENLDQDDSIIEVIDLDSSMELEQIVPVQAREILNTEAENLNLVDSENGSSNDLIESSQLEENMKPKATRISVGKTDKYKKRCRPEKKNRRKTKKTMKDNETLTKKTSATITSQYEEGSKDKNASMLESEILTENIEDGFKTNENREIGRQECETEAKRQIQINKQVEIESLFENLLEEFKTTQKDTIPMVKTSLTQKDSIRKKTRGTSEDQVKDIASSVLQECKTSPEQKENVSIKVSIGKKLVPVITLTTEKTQKANKLIQKQGKPLKQTSSSELDEITKPACANKTSEEEPIVKLKSRKKRGSKLDVLVEELKGNETYTKRTRYQKKKLDQEANKKNSDDIEITEKRTLSDEFFENLKLKRLRPKKDRNAIKSKDNESDPIQKENTPPTTEILCTKDNLTVKNKTTKEGDIVLEDTGKITQRNLTSKGKTDEKASQKSTTNEKGKKPSKIKKIAKTADLSLQSLNVPLHDKNVLDIVPNLEPSGTTETNELPSRSEETLSPVIGIRKTVLCLSDISDNDESPSKQTPSGSKQTKDQGQNITVVRQQQDKELEKYDTKTKGSEKVDSIQRNEDELLSSTVNVEEVQDKQLKESDYLAPKTISTGQTAPTNIIETIEQQIHDEQKNSQGSFVWEQFFDTELEQNDILETAPPKIALGTNEYELFEKNTDSDKNKQVSLGATSNNEEQIEKLDQNEEQAAPVDAIESPTNFDKLLKSNKKLSQNKYLEQISEKSKILVLETNDDQLFEDNTDSDKNKAAASSSGKSNNEEQIENMDQNEKQAAPMEVIIESPTNFDKLLESTIAEASSAKRKRKMSVDEQYFETPNKRTKELSENKGKKVDKKKIKKIQGKPRKLYNIEDTSYYDSFTIEDEPAMNLIGETPIKELQQKPKATVKTSIVHANPNQNAIETNFDKPAKSKDSTNLAQNINKQPKKNKHKKRNTETFEHESCRRSTEEEGNDHQEQFLLWDSNFDSVLESLRKTYKECTNKPKRESSNKKKKSTPDKYKSLNSDRNKRKRVSKQTKEKHDNARYYKKLYSQMSSAPLDLNDNNKTAQAAVPELSNSKGQRNQNLLGKQKNVSADLTTENPPVIIRRLTNSDEHYRVSPINTPVNQMQTSKNMEGWVEESKVLPLLESMNRKVSNIEIIIVELQKRP